jgi:predicted GNAT family acetyltransferase
MKNRYLPLSLMNSIDKYSDWYRMNPLTTPVAKEQTLIELMELYKIDRQSDYIRYHFYRHTYFENFPVNVLEKFDKLMAAMLSNPEILPIQLLELSDLQYAFDDPEDKNVFSRMVFPRLRNEQKVDLLTIGEKLKEYVLVRFTIHDKTGSLYTQREPLEPREIGQLYQLFYRENYPKEISDNDHHFVVVDENERLIGGLTWKSLEKYTVLLDGVVVISSLQGKGIASSMMENFFTAMAASNVKIIKAHFLFGNYYMKHYFKVDKKWGALVKTLNE